MNRKRIPYGTKLPVSFTAKDLEASANVPRSAEEFGRHMVVESKRLPLDLPLDDMEDIQGHVAAEANHTCDSKR